MMVWQIIDLRHPPSALDHQMSEYLKASGLPYLTVATKADKLSKNEIAKNKAMVKRELGLTEDELVVFSAQSGLNKEVLLARIETLIGEARLLSEKRITEGEGLWKFHHKNFSRKRKIYDGPIVVITTEHTK